MRRVAIALLVVWATLAPPAALSDDTSADGRLLRVGSKSFTESVVLGEIATLLVRNAGIEIEHRRELGGTRILFGALERGEIDIYPEYTGTLTQEILRDSEIATEDALREALGLRGIRMTAALGFNNTYAIGLRPEQARSLGIRAISDLVRHPGLRLGLSNEFLDRGDGWPSLRAHYRLPQTAVRGLDHDLAYRALEAGSIDVMDLYTTDAGIVYYGLTVLEDDLEFFPRYEAVFLFRAELERRSPGAVRRLQAAAGTIDESRMRAMNARVKLDGESETAQAAGYLAGRFGESTVVLVDSRLTRLIDRTREHLLMVGLAMTAGVLVAVPLGIVAAEWRRAGAVILAAVGVVQTIPALALLVFMIPILGIYEPPAIAALFLYSLLPIVRNTHSGLEGIPLPLRESAEALGLSRRARLVSIELPLASRSILAGIKISTVIIIGFATLGALIGAGGYGQPIFTGIRLDDFGLILEGALPAAGLALVVQALFGLAERFWVPRGLRLKRAR